MKNTKNKVPKQTKKVSVMYQNLQGSWYAFAELEGELYFAKVPLKYAVEKNDEKALEVLKKTVKTA
ncbi:MAG: hypothetical protein KA116_11115 [Proteobacteria bacterium]|nr:hypothetical protein [Pseudomonadota bacterium]